MATKYLGDSRAIKGNGGGGQKLAINNDRPRKWTFTSGVRTPACMIQAVRVKQALLDVVVGYLTKMLAVLFRNWYLAASMTRPLPMPTTVSDRAARRLAAREVRHCPPRGWHPFLLLGAGLQWPMANGSSERQRRADRGLRAGAHQGRCLGRAKQEGCLRSRQLSCFDQKRKRSRPLKVRWLERSIDQF